jgi:hypothetical protein
MLLEAEKKVKKLVRKGKGKEQAIKEVASDMEMTGNEIDALTGRVASASPEQKPSPQDLAPSQNVISFKNPEEVEQAAGILMYKGIPWRIKSPNPCFISFDDSKVLSEAKEALARRWDFLESANRTVATIEFDNLDEYNRVVEFIRKNNLTAQANPNSTLSEDISDELVASVAKNKGKKIAPVDICAKNQAYEAVSKGYSKVNEDNFASNDKNCRSLKIRKKWK